MKSETTDPQIRLLKGALASRDHTILAIGFGRHNPYADCPSYATGSASALVKRGFLTFVKNAAWGSVYRLTPTGEQFIKSLLHEQPNKQKCV